MPLFIKPCSLSEALEMLQHYQERTVILNGGTDITEKINKKQILPEVILYIHELEELKGIYEKDDYLIIGGAETYSNVLESPFSKHLKALRQAIEVIASPPIRTVATLAGNIGSAMPAADCNVALLALNAEVVLASLGSQRVVAIEEIFESPGKTKINNDELIKEIRIPSPKANTYSSFEKLTRRKAQDIAQVSAGVSLELEGRVCNNITIALGAINPTPFRSRSLEQMVTGKDIITGLNDIKNIFPEEGVPRDDRFKPYKTMVTQAVITKAILKAFRESGEEVLHG